jgi:hypothetical protein
MLIVVFFVLTLPAPAVLVTRDVLDVSPLVTGLSVWLSACNSSVNWMVYGAISQRFRQGYKRAFMIVWDRFCWCCYCYCSACEPGYATETI